jgi:hypothetical protein
VNELHEQVPTERRQSRFRQALPKAPRWRRITSSLPNSDGALIIHMPHHARYHQLNGSRSLDAYERFVHKIVPFSETYPLNLISDIRAVENPARKCVDGKPFGRTDAHFKQVRFVAICNSLPHPPAFCGRAVF